MLCKTIRSYCDIQNGRLKQFLNSPYIDTNGNIISVIFYEICLLAVIRCHAKYIYCINTYLMLMYIYASCDTRWLKRYHYSLKYFVWLIWLKLTSVSYVGKQTLPYCQLVMLPILLLGLAVSSVTQSATYSCRTLWTVSHNLLLTAEEHCEKCHTTCYLQLKNTPVS